MRASWVLALLCAAAVTAMMPSSAHAITIHRNNPFRSFNTSGVNYGSMQWEKSHRKPSAPAARMRHWRR